MCCWRRSSPLVRRGDAYWLAEPIEGQKWAALITQYELARTPSGTTAYIEIGKTTLDELMRTGLS